MFTISAPPATGNSSPPPPDPPGSQAKSAAPPASAGVQPKWYYWVLSVVLIVVGVLVGTNWDLRPNGPRFDAQNVNPFALFYVAAQSLERLGELLSAIPFVGAYIGAHGFGKDVVNKEKAVARRGQARVGQTLAALNGDSAQLKKQTESLAAKQSDLDLVRANRSVFFFGVNTMLACLLAGLLAMDFLKTIGVTLSPADAWLGIAVTGLAVGGGTQPLHDLIGNIQKSKEQKEDATVAAPQPA